MCKINKVLALIAMVSALCGHSGAADGDFQQMLDGITTSAKLSNGVKFYFEMPLKKEILKSIGGKGVDVLIVGDGNEDSVIRHYYKPKFSNEAFSSVYRDMWISVENAHCAYEDRVVPPSSEEAKMLRKFFWFKRMAINFLIFEEKFGAEINEIAGDDYGKLKKDFSKAAKRFNPEKEIEGKEDIERRLEKCRESVVKSSIAEGARLRLQELRLLCTSAHFPSNASTDDSTDSMLASKIDLIRKNGAGKTREEVQAISRHVETTLTILHETLCERMAIYKKSGIPVEKLFSNAAETTSVLDHSMDGSEKERLSKFRKLVEDFSIAKKNFDTRRKNEDTLRQRYASLQKKKSDVDISRLVGEEDRRTIEKALESSSSDTVISDENAKTVADIITGAEQKLALFKAHTAGVLNYLKTATARYSAISHSGFDEADAFGSEIAKNECEDLLSRASVSPLDFSESHKKRTEELLTIAESRIATANEVNDLIEEMTQQVNTMSNNVASAFLEIKETVGKVRGDKTEYSKAISNAEERFSKEWDKCSSVFYTIVTSLSANPFEKYDNQRLGAAEALSQMEKVKEKSLNGLKETLERITNKIMSEAVNRIIGSALVEERDNAALNFYGFHLGMTISDVAILAKYYGLAQDEWGCEVADSGEVVKALKFTLLGLKRITKSGNTYESILASVRERLKMPESDDSITQVRTISKQIARITEDDGLRIFHERDGDPAKSMLGKGWEKAKDTINKSDELDLLGGLLLLNAIGL